MSKRIERRANKLGWSAGKKELFIESLGKSVDRVVAETFGVSLQFVFACRTDLGIERFHKTKTKRAKKPKKPKKPFLPEALIERLGTIPDAHLAREFGVGARTVTRARNERGIKNHKSRIPLGVQAVVKELISQQVMTNAEIARCFEVSERWVWRERRAMGLGMVDKSIANIPEVLPLLGTMSDAELGRMFGFSRGAVAHLRNKMRVPIFCPEGWKRPPLKKSLEKPWVWVKKVNKK